MPANSEPVKRSSPAGESERSPSMQETAEPRSVFDFACAYRADGQSVIPIKLDGSKHPLSRWKKYQSELASEAQLKRLFDKEDPPALATVCGKVSGNMEALDFDHQAEATLAAFQELLEEALPGLFNRLCLVETPRDARGFQLRYRVHEVTIPGNAVLARDPAAPDDEQVLIETRGEGGYVLNPGSPERCHETGRPYQCLAGPPSWELPLLLADEWETIRACAAALNRDFPPAEGNASSGGDITPMDDYDRRGPTWGEILEPHGWVMASQVGDELRWRRPGKDRGHSATTGTAGKQHGKDWLYVFTSSASPFAPDKCYGKARAYALLNHAGDFKAAARALREQGYGSGPRPGPGPQKVRAAPDRGEVGNRRMHPPHNAEDLPPRNGQAANTNGHATSGQVQDQSPAAPPSETPEPLLSEVGNSIRLVKTYGRIIRWVRDVKQWFVWNNNRWVRDAGPELTDLAKRVIRQLWNWAVAELAKLPSAADRGEGGVGGEDDDTAKRLKYLKRVLSFCLRSESAPKIKGMLHLSQSEMSIVTTSDVFDRDPWLLHTMSGTYAIKKGVRRDPAANDMNTQLCPTMFNPHAKCPLWEATLLKMFGGKQHMVDFVQRLCGYFLTGLTTEKVLPIFCGGGDNGKSLLLEVLLEVMGPDYSMKATREMLISMKHKNKDPMLVNLQGKRLVAAIETGDGDYLDEPLIKELTGGDTIRARDVYQSYVQFTPTHKVVLATNYRPRVRGRDQGIWGRLLLVPFDVHFWDPDKGEIGREELRADKTLKERLLEEREGVLAWMVRGSVAWCAQGLRPPAEVLDATKEYRREEDQLGTFLQDHCRFGADYRLSARELNDRFRCWQEKSGEKEPFTETRVGLMMRAKGYDKVKSDGLPFYKGLTWL